MQEFHAIVIHLIFDLGFRKLGVFFPSLNRNTFKKSSKYAQKMVHVKRMKEIDMLVYALA